MLLKPFEKHLSNSLCLLEYLFPIFLGQYEVIGVF